MDTRRLPLWLRIGWTAFVLLWIPVSWSWYGPGNFLWFCDLANLWILAALWTGSRLLFSWVALSILAVQLLWVADFAAALAGFHPVGGTAYMFDPAVPLPVRGLSLFHAVVPFLLLFALHRLGYDRRALPAQTITAWLLLPASLLFGSGKDLNWVYGPFDRPQHAMPAWLYFGLVMLAYPCLLYFPTHLVLARLFARPPART